MAMGSDPAGDSPRPVQYKSNEVQPHATTPSATPGPRARMVRMSVGQTPDWDTIASDKVLEAWTTSGGDVHQMAARLSGLDATSYANFEGTAGAVLLFSDQVHRREQWGRSGASSPCLHPLGPWCADSKHVFPVRAISKHLE
jgi:hypothetical protein